MEVTHPAAAACEAACAACSRARSAPGNSAFTGRPCLCLLLGSREICLLSPATGSTTASSFVVDSKSGQHSADQRKQQRRHAAEAEAADELADMPLAWLASAAGSKQLGCLTGRAQ